MEFRKKKQSDLKVKIVIPSRIRNSVRSAPVTSCSWPATAMGEFPLIKFLGAKRRDAAGFPVYPDIIIQGE